MKQPFSCRSLPNLDFLGQRLLHSHPQAHVARYLLHALFVSRQSSSSPICSLLFMSPPHNSKNITLLFRRQHIRPHLRRQLERSPRNYLFLPFFKHTSLYKFFHNSLQFIQLRAPLSKSKHSLGASNLAYCSTLLRKICAKPYKHFCAEACPASVSLVLLVFSIDPFRPVLSPWPLSISSRPEPASFSTFLLSRFSSFCFNCKLTISL